MIYMKDGKLLTKDGKLCKTCCAAAGDDCEFCNEGETPLEIRVTFSSSVDCPDCYWNQSSLNPHSFRYYAIAAMINRTFIVPQTPATPCWWEKFYDVSGGIVKHWEKENCDGTADDTWSMVKVRIRVRKVGIDSMQVLAAVCDVTTTYFASGFSAIGVGGLTKCIEKADIPDQSNCGDLPPNDGCAGGIASVEEIW